MSLNVDALSGKLITAGRGLAGNIWSQMETYAIPELKKIAVQIVAIAENIDDYTEKGAKALLKMQFTASVGVIGAMTSLVLLEVERAINAILDAVREFVNGKLPFPLV